METEIPAGKDRIDILVDTIDQYYFRIGNAADLLAGTTNLKLESFVSDVRGLFETKSGRASNALFYENLSEVRAINRELAAAIDEAATLREADREDYSTMLGFVLGLRMAGIDSERTKQMVRTWRLGYPQDDD